MSEKWLFVSKTDLGDADYQTRTFEIEDREVLNKVKMVYDMMLPIVGQNHAFGEKIKDLHNNDVDLKNDKLNEDNYDEFWDFMADLFVMNGEMDTTAHSLVEMKLYKIEG